MFKTIEYNITFNTNEYSVTDESIHDLANLFEDAGFELFCVGGCVRDALLKKQAKDIDLCTNAKPEQVKEILAGYGPEFTDDGEIKVTTGDRFTAWDSGIKHGTLTILDHLYGTSFEVTTYRVDGKYLDGRHPEEVTFTPSLEEDLKRRDFTINSFAYNPSSHELLMLDESFLYDLKLGVIRCVGDPNKRFQEDALRMMRAIRFSAQLGFNIDEATYKAICDNYELLGHISAERIRDELTKILLSDNPQKLELLATTKLEHFCFDAIDFFNLLTVMLNEKQHNKYHYTDVFHHTMDVIKATPKEFNVRWAAFFHDTGKPYDKTVDEAGWEHYYNHPNKSAAIADRIMENLKFSNEQKEVIHNYVFYHDYSLSKVNNSKFKNMIVTIGEDNFINFLKLREADGMAHDLSMSTNFAIDAVSVCKNRYIKYLTNPEPLRIKDLDINGNDLKEEGFEGREIGDALKHALEYVLEHPEHNIKNVLLNEIKCWWSNK